MDYKIPYTKEDLAKIRALVSSNKEQIAAIYSEYQEVAKNLESPEERIQKLKNERKGQIEVRNSGNGIFHLIPYSMKYDNSDPNKKQQGAKMHLFFGKKEGDQFKIVIRGSNTFGDKNNPVLDQPYFLTEQEARDFIANVDHQHIQTAVTLEDWRFVITDRWHEGYRYDPNLQQNIRDKLYVQAKDVIKVDTICGPAYMHKKSRWAKKDEDLEEALDQSSHEGQFLDDFALRLLQQNLG